MAKTSIPQPGQPGHLISEPDLSADLLAKWETLLADLRGMGRVLIAYSGGVREAQTARTNG